MADRVLMDSDEVSLVDIRMRLVEAWLLGGRSPKALTADLLEYLSGLVYNAERADRIPLTAEDCRLMPAAMPEAPAVRAPGARPVGRPGKLAGTTLADLQGDAQALAQHYGVSDAAIYARRKKLSATVPPVTI